MGPIFVNLTINNPFRIYGVNVFSLYMVLKTMLYVLVNGNATRFNLHFKRSYIVIINTYSTCSKNGTYVIKDCYGIIIR